MGSALEEVSKRPEFKANKQKWLGFPRWSLFHALLFLLCRFIVNLLFVDCSKFDKKANSVIQSFIDKSNMIQHTKGVVRLEKMHEMLRSAMPSILQQIIPIIGPGLIAMKLTNYLTKKWLGSDELAKPLNKALPHNITTEMGLRVGDLADIARNYPDLVNYLSKTTSLDEIEDVKGGIEFRSALDNFLAIYGVRGFGEIDISNQRWSENPMLLMPSIMGQIKGLKPGEHREKHEQGKKEAEEAAANLIEQVRKTRWGFFKAAILTRLIHVYRCGVGFREHPKFTIISFLGRFKDIILDVARHFVDKGILDNEEQIFFLNLKEIYSIEQGRPNFDAKKIIQERQERYEQNKKLTPPRILTSDGEMVTATFKDSVAIPQGALQGQAVSYGVVEGVARVMRMPNESSLMPGEILVAPFTDPGWTPLFNSAAGLVTEVGGVLTHGSVVAREYGIPAVVGVDNATKLIETGDYIHIDGGIGYVYIIRKKE